MPDLRFSRAILVADGASVETIFAKAGKKINGVIGSDEVSASDYDKTALESAAKEIGYSLPNL
jgi:hypothetical protein